MKNIHEVLRAKEQLLEQTQKDIEALRHTIKLLSDGNEEAAPASASSLSNMPVPPVVMRPAGAKDSSYSTWDGGPKQFP